MFDKARRAIGREDLWFHDPQRSLVSNARRRGVPESVVMRMSGHRTRNVFDRHNIVEDGYVRAAVQVIEAGANRDLTDPPVAFGHAPGGLRRVSDTAGGLGAQQQNGPTGKYRWGRLVLVAGAGFGRKQTCCRSSGPSDRRLDPPLFESQARTASFGCEARPRYGPSERPRAPALAESCASSTLSVGSAKRPPPPNPCTALRGG